MSNEDKRSFEEALSELEAHVRRLDGGDLPLEDSLATFEAGVKLIRECSEQISMMPSNDGTELSDTATEDQANG